MQPDPSGGLGTPWVNQGTPWAHQCCGLCGWAWNSPEDVSNDAPEGGGEAQAKGVEFPEAWGGRVAEDARQYAPVRGEPYVCRIPVGPEELEGVHGDGCGVFPSLFWRVVEL